MSHPWEPNLYFHVHEKCTIDNITLLGLSPRLYMCGFNRPAFAMRTLCWFQIYAICSCSNYKRETSLIYHIQATSGGVRNLFLGGQDKHNKILKYLQKNYLKYSLFDKLNLT